MNNQKLNQIATYCFAQTVINTTSGVWNIDLADIEKKFDVDIVTFKDYIKIVNRMWDFFQFALLDINESDDTYCWSHKYISVNIGTDFYNTDEEDADYE